MLYSRAWPSRVPVDPVPYQEGRLQVFLVHPGGQFWAKKEVGAWTIPKGKAGEGKDELAAAKREFQEATSWHRRPEKSYRARVFAGDCDPNQIRSNSFSIE